MTGPDTSSIALMVASRGARPCSMWCSTASTTTMASSTTMPIASTRPNSVRLFRLKPTAAMTAKVPTMATGTATSGMMRRPPVLQEQQHHDGDQDDRVAQRLEHLADRLADERRGVVADLVVDALGEVAAQLLHLGLDAVGRRPGRWRRAAGRWPGRRDGLPLKRVLMSWFLAPSSTRATSLRRTIRPSGVDLDDDRPRTARRSVSRPSVLERRAGTPGRSAAGGWPIWPAATWQVLLADGVRPRRRPSGRGRPASPGRPRSRML